jgi:hypothetical protein
MKILRIAFLGLLAMLGADSVWNAKWYTSVECLGHSWTLGPTTSPIWAKPEPAAYGVLKSAFPEIPPPDTKGYSAHSDLDSLDLISGLFVALWLSSAGVGFIYYLASERRQDHFLHILAKIGLCLSIAVPFCYVVLGLQFLAVLGPLGAIAGFIWGFESFRVIPYKGGGFSLEQ